MPQAAQAEKFLRVRTPKTTDGVTIAYDDERQVIYRTTHLPLSAKPHLERENSKRPKHLQHLIEVIEGDNNAPVKASKSKVQFENK